VVLYKDRLVRFGFELIEYFAELNDVGIKIIEHDDSKTDEEELSEDLIQIITVFSARLSGKRANKSKSVLDEINRGNK